MAPPLRNRYSLIVIAVLLVILLWHLTDTSTVNDVIVVTARCESAAASPTTAAASPPTTTPKAAAVVAAATTSTPPWYTGKCQYEPKGRTYYDVMAGTPLSYTQGLTSTWEWKNYSQYGEDGVIDKINKYLGQELGGTYVEFGVEGGEKECNVLNLRLHKKWSGLMMDGTPENLLINKRKAFVTHDNVVSLFERYNVSKRVNLLSVDTDLKDYWITKSLLEGGYSADVWIMEINGQLGPTEAMAYRRDHPKSVWDGSWCNGQSLQAATRLMHKYGYTLVWFTKEGINAFYVNNDRLGEGRCVKDEYVAARTAAMWRQSAQPRDASVPCDKDMTMDPPV